MSGASIPGCVCLVPWPVFHPEAKDPGGSCSWAVSQLATHACVGHFKETHGHNSSELVPSAHGGEPRTGCEKATTKTLCVLFHVIIELYLGAGACQ